MHKEHRKGKGEEELNRLSFYILMYFKANVKWSSLAISLLGLVNGGVLDALWPDVRDYRTSRYWISAPRFPTLIYA